MEAVVWGSIGMQGRDAGETSSPIDYGFGEVRRIANCACWQNVLKSEDQCDQ
jgi:hypothetical protein